MWNKEQFFGAKLAQSWNQANFLHWKMFKFCWFKFCKGLGELTSTVLWDYTVLSKLYIDIKVLHILAILQLLCFHDSYLSSSSGLHRGLEGIEFLEYVIKILIVQKLIEAPRDEICTEVLPTFLFIFVYYNSKCAFHN